MIIFFFSRHSKYSKHIVQTGENNGVVMHLWHVGFYTFLKRNKAQFILEFEDLALS